MGARDGSEDVVRHRPDDDVVTSIDDDDPLGVPAATNLGREGDLAVPREIGRAHV